MVVLIEEILGEIFRQIGDISGTSDDSKKKPKNEDSKNDVANFMFSGQKPLELALKFFGSTNTAILTEEHVELLTDKDESVKFQPDDLISIEAIKDVLQTSIKKLECKKFNEKHVEFWNALKNVTELELSDFNFADNEKYGEVVKNMKSLEKVTVELDIYCLGYLEGVSITCKELVLKGEAFDQIENAEDLNIKFSSVKNLTIIGRYVGWGPTDMSLESLIKNLKKMCPELEKLSLFIDDDNVDSEVPKTFIELISKPKIDENLELNVVFNFLLHESTWEKSNFHEELKKHPNVRLDENGSKSKIKLGEKKLIEFNLSSEMDEEEEEDENDDDEKDDEEEDGEEEDPTAEPAAKKKKA